MIAPIVVIFGYALFRFVVAAWSVIADVIRPKKFVLVRIEDEEN